MASAPVIQLLLDEVMGRAAAVPGSRPGSAIQDLVLSIELGVFFLVWLREWKRVTPRSLPLFVIYAANLLGAALWCALGVYIHLLEPVPTERSSTWLAFMALGAVTPVIFPLVSFTAFSREAPTPRKAPLPYAVAAVTAAGYALVLATGADLSLGGMLPKELWLTPWHAADGRSYGGEAHGVTFDLMSSYPCYRGDSMFVMSSLFLVSNMVSVVVLHSATLRCKGPAKTAAWRLRLGVFAMLGNCISILYLLVVFGLGMNRVFDVFHALQGLNMAACFFELRSCLRMSDSDAKSA